MQKPVRTDDLTFDGKNGFFEHIEDFFHTVLEMLAKMIEAMKIKHFQTNSRKEALQNFKNNSAPNKKTAGAVLIVFRRNYVEPVSQAKAKHKWPKIMFQSKTRLLSDFLEELNKCADWAFGANSQHKIDSLLHAKVAPQLKQSNILAYLETGAYDQIVAHIPRE